MTISSKAPSDDDDIRTTQKFPPRERPARAGRLRALTIDDEAMWARVLGRMLAAADIALDIEHDPIKGIDRAASDSYDAILLDMSMPGMTGLEALRRIRELGVVASVIMLTSDESAATAAACFRAGAFHYLTKQAPHEELIAALQAASHQTAMRRRVQGDAGLEARGALVVGDSPAMQKVRSSVERLARTEVSVLIQGESGTGKELVARALHDLGPRRDRPFVAVNCSAIPETLIDSELFGHSRGAFTGASENRPGLFEQADGGTLFLDEIGDMPIAVQSRLLRALQDGEVRPLGAQTTKSVDVRVIAATHVDLQKAVEERRFRQDLYFRFSVVTLWLPPLRDRIADLPVLAAHFLRAHAGAETPELTPAALEALMHYTWPGNVRELQNAIHHALAMGGGGAIDVTALPGRIRAAPTAPADATLDDDDMLFADAKRVAVAKFEREYLEGVLRRCRGNISEASRRAGLDRANFRRLLQRHDIDSSRYRE